MSYPFPARHQGKLYHLRVAGGTRDSYVAVGAVDFPEHPVIVARRTTAVVDGDGLAIL